MNTPSQQSIKIMTVKPCSEIKKLPSYSYDFKNFYKPDSYYRQPEPSKLDIYKHLMKRFEEAKKQDEETHKLNIEALENNKIIKGYIVNLMKSLGIPDTYKERIESRSRTPKYETKNAGYIGDISRNIPVFDGFDENKIKTLEAEYERYRIEAEKEEEELKVKKQKEDNAAKEKRRNDIELASIIVRNGLNEDLTWEEALEHLRNKNSKVNLAIAMLDVRNDWNDGCYKVEYALSKFKAVDEIDKAIEASVQSAIHFFNTESRDGRIFRDIQWNYDAIFSLVDEQLVKDVTKAHSVVNRFN